MRAKQTRMGKEPWLPDGYSRIFRLFVFSPSGFWTMATLQNLISSFPWIAPPHPPPQCNPRNGRDQILPFGNLERSGKTTLIHSCRNEGRTNQASKCSCCLSFSKYYWNLTSKCLALYQLSTYNLPMFAVHTWPYSLNLLAIFEARTSANIRDSIRVSGSRCEARSSTASLSSHIKKVAHWSSGFQEGEPEPMQCDDRRITWKLHAGIKHLSSDG